MQSINMTINLRKQLLRLHSMRRRKRAAGLVREAVARFSKSDIDKIRISRDLNEFIAKNASGASFMWSRIALNVEKSDDKVEVKLRAPKATAPVAAAAKKEEVKKPKAEAKKEGPEKAKAVSKEPKQQKQA